RHAEEIISSARYTGAIGEIETAVRKMPIFLFPGKSSSNPNLDVVQQVCNTYFDRLLGADGRWQYHPLATKIKTSGLTADFRKTFGTAPDRLTVQAEVQFGNMSRWYSDIFKFQAAYSQNVIQLGLSIVPMRSLSTRIDSNIVNFERVKRELPAALLSITLPILVIGIEPDSSTSVYDLSTCGFPGGLKDIVVEKMEDNRYRIVDGYLRGAPESTIGPSSKVGFKPKPKSK
ncbi:MAG: hypothetical protein QOD51_1330, partial [Candidatus Eremiobacteraeota bacterium]|nr:hypothetical protein [Candidatus Eremiobacteraeota bacterium]